MKYDYFINKVANAVYSTPDTDQIEKRRQVLGKVYLGKAEPWTNEIWPELYKDWLMAGGEECGLERLRTYAVFYFRENAKAKTGYGEVWTK